ncbi:hypothetical protein [Methylorubrum extorquens]|uniref:hypothetical protein n=1 Tax=Methylorubrum extorquens TaxID=408 RepID=UPI001EE5E92F|nr:hypothetical protein [Methylorubrum extorquens]MCG5249603.1 hypothetical protein [Methylorubrum extorquens]
MNLARKVDMRYWNVKRNYHMTSRPFAIGIDEWRRCWMESPLREFDGHVARIDDSKPWTPDNIHYVAAPCARSRKPKDLKAQSSNATRTLTIREWAREMRAKR